MFPDERACGAYLEALRWPGGFACPRCGTFGKPYHFDARPGVLRCPSCRTDTSLTAHTVMHKSHTPLSTWFWGAYLITTADAGHVGAPVPEAARSSRHETAFQLLHKLRAGMVRPERDPVGGEHAVEIDETLVGGRTRGEGRGVHHKVYVIGVVERRHRKDGEDRSAEGTAQRPQ